MEGIPEEDLRAHEKRLAGKDKDEPDSTDTIKVPQPPIGMPPIPPLGMMAAPPMMPMAFPGIPFGISPMQLPMMPMPMMAQLRPPMPMMPPTVGNPAATLMPPNPAKPLFPSGATDVSIIEKSCFCV